MDIKRKLKIAQVSPLWYPVPPKGYGGTEWVVSKLTEELINRGHQVTVFASGDSKTKAKLVSVTKKNLYSMGVPWLFDSWNITNLIEAFSRAKDFDIIHTHIDVYDPIFRAQCSTPSIATLHNPFWPKGKKGKGKWYAYHGRELLYNRFPKLPYVAISDNYREQCRSKIKFVKTIYHGIDISKLKFNPNGGDYFVWFGRFAENKGAHIAIKIAKKLGLKLLLAGKAVSPENKKYLEENIKPSLTKNIKFIGEITEKEKPAFLGNAKAFLYPLQWEEPFGITMIEAQACGTPVVSFARGSVPEVVKDKKTGFVVKTENEMLKAVKNVSKISRKECRKWTEDNFTIQKMTEKYEEVYYQLINKNK